MTHNRLTNNWLRRSPIRYPFIPKRGIPNQTPPMRSASPDRLMRKEMLAFPSPLMTLIKVLFIYINGQIHASVFKKSPDGYTNEQPGLRNHWSEDYCPSSLARASGFTPVVL